MRTCETTCVTPYVVEAHSDGSKTGCTCMGWRRRGIGIVMPPYERWRWRGVRRTAFLIRRQRIEHPRHKLIDRPWHTLACGVAGKRVVAQVATGGGVAPRLPMSPAPHGSGPGATPKPRGIPRWTASQDVPPPSPGGGPGQGDGPKTGRFRVWKELQGRQRLWLRIARPQAGVHGTVWLAKKHPRCTPQPRYSRGSD